MSISKSFSSLFYYGILSVLVSGGCATGDGTAVPDESSAATPVALQEIMASLLHNSLQCGPDFQEPTVRWISDSATLAARYEVLNRYSDELLPTPSVDFSNERILLIAMGERPTGGYLLNFSTQAARFGDNTLVVEVAWQEPLPGYQQAQVVTSPCLILQFPALQPTTVNVVDQDGQSRIRSVLEGDISPQP